MTRRLSGERGQGLVEFTMVAPLLLVVALGVVEASYAILDKHVVTRLAREGSNLISRDATLQDAAAAMVNMSTLPVNFGTSSTVILSVVHNVGTIGATNYQQNVLYRRYKYGALASTSTLTTAGAGSFGGPPNYQAANSDNDTNLRVAGLPANLIPLGGMLYVTEIYSTHQLITPFDKFGIPLPTSLYSIAYF